MKKVSVFLSAACFGLACAAPLSFAACNKTGDAPRTVTINSFDDYKQAQRADYRCMIGDISLFDSEGESGSYVKVDILHTSPVLYERTTSIEYTPRIVFQAKDDVFGYDFTDVSNVGSFAIDAGNENDHDAELVFWLDSDGDIIFDTSVDLPARTKKTCVFPLNHIEIGEKAGKCSRLTIGIIDRYANDQDVKTVYSFDNFRAEVYANALDSTVKKVCAENEILSFGSESDLLYVNGANLAALWQMGVPAGAKSYVSNTPIGNALSLTWFGKQLLEGIDLSYFGEQAVYAQMHGVKLNERLFETLDMKKLQNGYSVTAEVYNPSATRAQTAYIVLTDEVNNFARGELKLEPLTKGKVVLKNADGLNFDKLTGLYLMYDTFNVNEKSSLYFGDLKFEKGE